MTQNEEVSIETYKQKLEKLDDQLKEFAPEEKAKSGFNMDTIKIYQRYIYGLIVVCVFILFYFLSYYLRCGFLMKNEMKIITKKNGKKIKKETHSVDLKNVLKWVIIFSVILCTGFFVFLKLKK